MKSGSCLTLNYCTVQIETAVISCTPQQVWPPFGAKNSTSSSKVTFQFHTLPRYSRAVRETEWLFLCRKSVMQTEDALDFQAKLGEQGMAERREQQRRKDCAANTHIFFSAYSLMAKPCNLLKLWTCTLPKVPWRNQQRVGNPGRQGTPVDNSRLDYWRIVGSPVLISPITNERLAAAGHFGILPLRVLALMRLSRRAQFGTHGGVRSRLSI